MWERKTELTVTTGESEEHKWEAVATRRPAICWKSQITSKLSVPVPLAQLPGCKPDEAALERPAGTTKRLAKRKERRRGGERRRRREKRGRVRVRRGSRGLWDIVGTTSCAAECVSSVADKFRSGDCNLWMFSLCCKGKTFKDLTCVRFTESVGCCIFK